MNSYVKILVTGDRHWNDRELIQGALLPGTGDTPPFVIHGGARGADRIAEQVAETFGLPCARVEANWGRLGKRAGVVRNEWMLNGLQPAIVYAFHDDIAHSKGTKHCIQHALTHDIPVRLFTHQGDIKFTTLPAFNDYLHAT